MGKTKELSKFRNWLTKFVCDFMITHVATPWYRSMIEGTIDYGLNAAMRDSLEDRPSPEHWTVQLAHRSGKGIQ